MSSMTMSNLEKYKNELKQLLNINDEELAKKFKSTMWSFKKQIEEIGGEGDFIKSLLKLDYDDMVVYDKDEDNVDDTQICNHIDDRNVKDCKDEKAFVCLCGKTHLKNLHLFTHEDCDKKLVIGSSCITQVEQLKDAYKSNKDLVLKLEGIIKKLKTSEKLLTHNPCKKCGDVCIKKNYEYKNPHQKNYCKDCLCGKSKCWIHCKTCYIKVLPASQPLNSWTKGKFKEDCGKCWYNKNKHQSWMKKK